MLDPLAGHHPCRLQDHQIVLLKTDGTAELQRIFVGRWRRVGEIHHVGNDPTGEARSTRKFFLLQTVDDHALDLLQGGREGIAEKIIHGIDKKPVSFPVEIVMVRKTPDRQFLQHLDDGNAQRNVHRNRKRVFRNDGIDFKFGNGPFEFLADDSRHPLDLLGQLLCANLRMEGLLRNFQNVRVVEVGLFDQHGPVDRSVRLPGDIKTDIPHPLEDLSPFSDLERDAIGAVNTSGNKGDPPCLAAMLHHCVLPVCFARGLLSCPLPPTASQDPFRGDPRSDPHSRPQGDSAPTVQDRRHSAPAWQTPW